MKVLVVGLGSMGKRRIRILKHTFGEFVHEIVGVDSQLSRREEAESLYQIVTYATLSEAIQEGPFNCGFVCTSPRYHGQITLELLEHGISVFSEINLVNDCHEEILKRVNTSGPKYFLSSTPLYSADRQYIGEYLSGEANLTYCYHVGQYLPDWHPWESYKNFFVGEVATNACREIMVIELPWLMGLFGEIESLHVQSKKNTSLEISFPDTYVISVLHKNGVVGTMCFDVVSRVPVREFTAFNENIYLTWGGKVDSIRILDQNKKQLVPVDIDAEKIRMEQYAEFINEVSYVNEVQAFFDYLLRDKKPLHTLEQDIHILELADRIEDGGT